MKLLLLFAIVSFAQNPADLDVKTKHIADQLRCPVCRGVPISESPATLAQDMTALIRKQLQEGKSEEEILNSFVDHYGEWILLRPKPHGLNLIVWILPGFVLLSGGGALFWAIRKWSRKNGSA